MVLFFELDSRYLVLWISNSRIFLMSNFLISFDHQFRYWIGVQFGLAVASANALLVNHWKIHPFFWQKKSCCSMLKIHWYHDFQATPNILVILMLSHEFIEFLTKRVTIHSLLKNDFPEKCSHMTKNKLKKLKSARWPWLFCTSKTF